MELSDVDVMVDEMVPAVMLPRDLSDFMRSRSPVILREDKVEIPAVRLPRDLSVFVRSRSPLRVVLPLTVNEDKVELPAVRGPGVKMVFWVVPILSVGPVSEPENTGSVELSLSVCRVSSVTSLPSVSS